MARKRTPKWLQAARTAGAPSDWIARALPRAGALPPATVTQALAGGRILLNGAVINDPFTPVRPDDVVEVDGRRIELHAPILVLAFHKPAGVIVAGQDPEGQGTVFEALQARLPTELQAFGWHAVGRLDRATTGLLLFTNDERVVQHVTSPTTALPKRYLATVESKVRDEQLQALVNGVTIDDGQAQALSAQQRGPHELELVITEGRYHQVRRMLNAVRLAVLKLHREAIGDVTLDVPVGEWRRLTDDEIERGLRFAISARPVAPADRT